MKKQNMDVALTKEALPTDPSLMLLKREEVLSLPAVDRLRWFHLLQFQHAELRRVVTDVIELIDKDPETRIVTLVGMTAAGKTTASKAIKNALIKRYRSSGAEIPVLDIVAPANGERSLSWRVLYSRMLTSAGVDHDKPLRGTKETEGRIDYLQSTVPVAQLREYLEILIRERGVRVLMIDEAFHLLRFAGYSAVMDTLKSLADIEGIKLLLIGNYDLADLTIEYAQVARRAEMVHFKPYFDLTKSRATHATELRPQPRTPAPGTVCNEHAFYSVVEAYQKNWPCANVPNLCAMWWQLMLMTVGSIGLLKMCLTRLAMLQMMSHSEEITSSMLTKMGKSPAAMDKIFRDLKEGHDKIKYSVYGSGLFALNEEQFLQVVGGRNV